MKRDETYRKHAFIRALGITTLLLVMLVSTASALASSTNYLAEITPSFSSVPLVAGEPVTFTANIRSLDQNGYTFTGSCDFWDLSVGDFLGSAPIIDNTATLSGVTFSKGSHNIMMVVSGDTYYAPNAFEFNLYVEDPNWLSISYHIQITPSPTQPVACEPLTLTANYISWDHPGYTFTGTCGFTDMSASSPVYLGSAPIINNTATLSGVTFSPGAHEIMVLGGDDHYIPTSFSIWLDVDESVNVPEFPSVANFSSNVTSGYAPLSVQFTDLSENTTGWNWDFGDGFNSTQQNPAGLQKDFEYRT